MPKGSPVTFDCEGVEGPNKYTYWVTADPAFGAASWVKLPHVTPGQVRAARLHRRLLTGDLAAPVACFPPLPGGTEAHYLRAVVAEITADCGLTLAGVGVEPDDDAAAEEPPVFKTKAAEEDEENPKCFALPELKLPEAWVHAEVDIRPSGRCQVKPVPEEEEPDPAASTPDALRDAFFAGPAAGLDGAPDPDPGLSKGLCRSIADDVDGTGKALWAVRAAPSGAAETPSASLCFAKSLKWPGAVTVASGFGAPSSSAEKPKRRLTSVYVGFGLPKAHKGPAATHTPRAPGAVGTECAMPGEEEADVVVEPPKAAEEE